MVSILWELRSQGLTNLQANECESVILFLDVLKTNGCKKKTTQFLPLCYIFQLGEGDKSEHEP